MVEENACVARTDEPSPTRTSSKNVSGPMVQFLPMRVPPRKIVPGSSAVPAPTDTVGST